MTVKSFVLDFGYFTDWGDIKDIGYSVVRHIGGRISYSWEGFWLQAVDAVNIGYYYWASHLSFVHLESIEKKFIEK